MSVQEKSIGAGLNPILMPIGHICVDVGKPSPNGVQMKEFYASGDELTPKVRKPYTITKQRERWTEEEHKKFLEALKLYGRAWRRIEEHIGSKTAVQIRSHAQKFFSKVVRESSSNADSVKSIEIPPPRPKRKPVHPYPRKLIHSSTKGISVPEQLERSSSPTSAYEQDNRSPSSVLSAVGSDTVWSTVSNLSNGCSSPVSSAAGSNPVGLLLEKQENGYPTSTSSAEEENRFPFPAPLPARSSPQDKSSLESDMGFKDHVFTRETSPVETHMTSLKLFGRTLLVTDSHRPSSPVVENIPQCHKSLPLSDIGSHQENLETDVQKTSPQSPEDMMQRDCSGISSQSAWNQWSCGIPPLFYCMQFQQENSNSAESTNPLPWWVSHGSLLFPLAQPFNEESRQTPPDSCMVASDVRDTNKEGSWTGSNTSTIGEAGIGERNSDVVDSRNGDKEKEPMTVFHFKASENSAFSSLKTSSPGNRAKGFMPYKRCVAERDVEQSQMGGNEREGQRIRLCL
ncbi:protein CCA1-like [Magnolia sinica]|uniref:protein CCA1-like n=1 Tax=Magnolia sinica TaxID=86752 RepID=UPI00265A5812|nr:protein CCA1-like [Magnolia sinica]